MATKDNKVFFAPELFINNGVEDISFYEKAFWSNRANALFQ